MKRARTAPEAFPKCAPHSKVDKRALLFAEAVREDCPEHLAWIVQFPCCVPGCGRWPVQAHHPRIPGGPEPLAMGRKCSDRHALPVCAACHLNSDAAIHRVGGEGRWWWLLGVDPFALGAKLWDQRIAESKMLIVKRAS